MANSTGLPDPHQPVTSSPAPQVTWDNVFPAARNYDGAPVSSDAGTLANVTAKHGYPGSGAPNEPIERPVMQGNGVRSTRR